MFQSDSIYQVLSIQCKTGPFRTALLGSWQASTAYPLAEGASRGKAAGLILLEAIRSMHNQRHPIWEENTGRGNSHHSGWLALANRFHLVASSDSVKSSSTDEVLCLGASGNAYVTLPLGMDRVSLELNRLAEASDILMSCLKEAPTSPMAWLEKMKTVKKQLTGKSCLSLNLNAGYLFPWTFRSIALRVMARAGSSGWSVWGSGVPFPDWGFAMSVAKLQDMSPDQKSHVASLARHCSLTGRPSTVLGLCQMLDYDGRLELLSYYCCLFFDSNCIVQGPEWFAENRQLLEEELVKYHHSHQIWACPGRLVELAKVQLAAKLKQTADHQVQHPGIRRRQVGKQCPRRRLQGKQSAQVHPGAQVVEVAEAAAALCAPDPFAPWRPCCLACSEQPNTPVSANSCQLVPQLAHVRHAGFLPNLVNVPVCRSCRSRSESSITSTEEESALPDDSDIDSGGGDFSWFL